MLSHGILIALVAIPVVFHSARRWVAKTPGKPFEHGQNAPKAFCHNKRSRWDSNPHTLTGAGFRDRCNTNYATAPETKRPPVQVAGGQKQSGRPDLNRGPLRPERSALPD